MGQLTARSALGFVVAHQLQPAIPMRDDLPTPDLHVLRPSAVLPTPDLRFDL